MIDYDEQLPKLRAGGSLIIDRIRKLPDSHDKFYEYHKRIMALRRYIIKYPNRKYKYAQEICDCQDEQKKLIQQSRILEQDKEKDKIKE